MALKRKLFLLLVAQYIIPYSFVAIAADHNSGDTAGFVRLIENNLQSNGGDTNDMIIIKDANFHKTLL